MIIATEVELNEIGCEKHTFTISVYEELRDNYVFCAQRNHRKKEKQNKIYYELTIPFDTLKNSSVYRDEILSYCLGRFTKEDEVTLKDVFIHKGYIKRFGNTT